MGTLLQTKLNTKDLKSNKNFIEINFIKDYFKAHNKTLEALDIKYTKEFCDKNKEFLESKNAYNEFLYNDIIKLFPFKTNLYAYNRDDSNFDSDLVDKFLDIFFNEIVPNKKEFTSTVAMWLCFYHSTMLDNNYKELFNKYNTDIELFHKFILEKDNGNKAIFEFLLFTKKMIENTKINDKTKREILKTKHKNLKENYDDWLTTDQYDGVYHYFLNCGN